MTATGLTSRCPASSSGQPHLAVPDIDPPVTIQSVELGKEPGEPKFMGTTRVCSRCWLFFFEPSVRLLAELRVPAPQPVKEPRQS